MSDDIVYQLIGFGNTPPGIDTQFNRHMIKPGAA